MADIQLSDITNGNVVNQEWQGTGVFDELMMAFNKNIELQYNKNRITGSDYATVYVQGIQTVLQQSMQFVLQEKQVEAQIASLEADNLLKAKQLEIAEQELALKVTEANRLRDTTEAELEKQWGYEVTRDADGELVFGASTGLGKVDKDIALIEEQEKSVYVERVLKDKETANLGLDEVVKTANTNPEAVYTPKYEEQ